MSTILQTEFSEPFVSLMKNRMEVSFHKYGPIKEGFPHKVDAISSLTARLREYAKTGNTEYLVDAANFAMIEFMLPRHPQAHFEGTDDNGSPGRRDLKTGLLTQDANAKLRGNE